MDVKAFEQNPLKRNSIATGFRNTLMMQMDFKIYIKKKREFLLVVVRLKLGLVV